jgi:hypothetical protein
LTGFSRLLEPPRLRTARRGIQDDRRATRLERFFDRSPPEASSAASPTPTCTTSSSSGGTVVLDADVWLRLGAAALALLLVPLALSPLTVVLIFAGVLVAQVVYELARHEAHAV